MRATTTYLVSVFLFAGSLLLCTSGLGMAGPVACGSSQRELFITNNSSQDLWLGGGGSALRSVCVVSASISCLANPDTINATTGACSCGTPQGVQPGTLACPGTASSTGSGTNNGLNCSCTSNSDCGSGAGCNKNLCYFTLPASPAAHSGSGSFTWELEKSPQPPQRGGWAEFCLDEASVTWQGNQLPSEVWWGGGIFARTGCNSDGTNCATGDCGAAPNSNCGAGVGGTNPATLAEFTLQRQANDFYDISIINGANVAEEAFPIAAPTATPVGTTPPYWCKAPGRKIFQGGKCDWNFIKYTGNVHYPEGEVHNYTSFLMSTSKVCSTSPNNPISCPAGYTCSGAPGGCYLQCTPGANACPGSLECLPAQDGKDYCQCGKEAECSGKGYCGTQFVPGLGVYLRQCGGFDGWWTADDFCGAYPSATIGPINCGGLMTDGDGSSQTSPASLLTCAAKGGNSAGNTTSCYNENTAQTYPATCCGCATYDQDDPDGLSRFWPKNGTSQCAKVNSVRANDVVWDSQIQPWLVNLKRACPTAYSYPYDDPTSTFQCRGVGAANLMGYHVAFMNLPKPHAP